MFGMDREYVYHSPKEFRSIVAAHVARDYPEPPEKKQLIELGPGLIAAALAGETILFFYCEDWNWTDAADRKFKVAHSGLYNTKVWKVTGAQDHPLPPIQQLAAVAREILKPRRALYAKPRPLNLTQWVRKRAAA